nr:transposase [Limosilactobacillus mucosae]
MVWSDSKTLLNETTLRPSFSGARFTSSAIFTFYDFPEAIRSTIYTTNVIESFNK